MKVVALVSGGKDSCYAMMRCIDHGHEIVALANLLPFDDSVDELDSYMYQTVGHQIVISYAECMGLPLFRRRIRGSSRHQHLSYAVTEGDEVEDMFILLNEVKQRIPSITAVSSGAIASDYQRLRVESVCSRLGLVSLAYLWKQDQTFLLEEMIRRGILAITIKVAAMGLNPAKHLGQELADLQSHLLQMKELYGINVCGEGGEYETLTLDCPLFRNARIMLDKFQVILHSADSIAPVGILHPLVFHLHHKKVDSSISSCSNSCSEKMSYICEVQGDSVPNYMVKCQSMDLASDMCTTKKVNLCISATRRDMFSIGCWIQNPSTTPEDLKEDLIAILKRIESKLSEHGFDWVNVLYIHLYISNMKEFALANEVYVRFITEKKCYLGVPSRSTIELPLLQVGLGNAYIEVLVAKDQSKRVLHVQSISCWAPSCIGPYSQATLHKEVLYLAGQLGLDPPTMMLCSGGPAAELEQALLNSEAVANCFNSSIASAILFVIYCSASLTSSQRTEVQHKMEFFIGQRVSGLQHKRRVSDPIFLYILATDLPKGALVEVKPVLHIPGNGYEIETGIAQPPRQEIANKWRFEYSEWHDSCCQIHTISGKICSAVVSVTNDVAAKVCSKSDEKLGNFWHHNTEKHVKEIAMFSVFLLDKILLENEFLWGDLTNLRFYYATNIPIATEVLADIFSGVFTEFAEVNKCIDISKEPIFNLVPVIGSGRSACTDNIISCELFALKQ
ncbi:diphthine--ammonia ligase isoform X2 [Phoenix dactylifera]|uniref:Diphthine--ammonia ligase n=1 Tax=Phoenix dactylifera TaxID=42345 RepID=A0A8B7CZZ3_PHODC|nr:diphthine--ammonia ligase isoform X2 [Phoenix dactylifera]